MSFSSLWGEEFSIDSKEKTSNILKKVNNPKDVKEKKTKISSKLSIEDKIQIITENVNRILGQHKSDTLVIKTKEELIKYIDKTIENGILALDTETNNSLDPITCKLMGPCLYTPGMKQAYIPINHIDYRTGKRLDWQLTEDDIKEQFSRLLNGVKIIYHNAQFDIRVIQCTCGIEMPYYWDTLIASQLLNENEEAGLKKQYILHINQNQEKYSIEHLFEKEKYEIFTPELFALYAATDAKMTYDLYEYQLNEFNKSENKNIYKLFMEVEMPCVQVVKDMELTGVVVDMKYAARLQNKYHKILSDFDDKIKVELDKLLPTIEAWKLTSEGQQMVGKKTKAEQLTNPINLGSSTQLAIILYDILKVPCVNKKTPRSTDKNTLPLILQKVEIPLIRLFVERKEYETLVNNFIDKIPTLVNPKTGRIHCSFNQTGTVTGRFSCSDPNLQQIPSHNKEIRLMFRAQKGYTLVGSDFSQQEPRLLSNYSRDENMINAYKQGKDLYATIASRVYHNNYEDNLEFYPDGRPSIDGAKRRSSVKGLLLGIMYGMGVPAIAEKIHSTKEEAQSIVDGFFKEFPKVKQWINKTEEDAKKTGYVEDWYGRRRRLNNLLLPEYEIKYINSNEELDFNPFLICHDREIDKKSFDKYKSLLSKAKYFKEIQNIKDDALKEGIEINSNTALIAGATRQCVNARIQGGAATMTKIAMIQIYNDKELNDLGFKLLIGVHDELIGECPKENADKVADRLTYIMKTCIADHCVVPFKCDADICDAWYYTSYAATILKEFNNYIKDGLTKDESYDNIINEHTECTKDILNNILKEVV